ncbi:MAG: hypothetical protein ACREFN_04395 [Acetobacteraceae bacterium]
MSLTTFLSPTPVNAQLWPSVRVAFCHAGAALADLPRRARDRATLGSLDFQMLAGIGRAPVLEELAKPLWRT